MRFKMPINSFTPASGGASGVIFLGADKDLDFAFAFERLDLEVDDFARSPPKATGAFMRSAQDIASRTDPTGIKILPGDLFIRCISPQSPSLSPPRLLSHSVNSL